MVTGSKAFWDEATPDEREILVQVATGSLKNSTYTLSAGPMVEEFHDLDDFIAGRVKKADEGRESDAWSDSPAAGHRAFTDTVARVVRDRVEEYGISRLAFVEKRDVRGPVGVLTMMSALIERADRQAVIVRLGRKLSALKGRHVDSGEAFLVVSDVATSGESIADAAKVIWQRGGRVPAALVIYDREQGAARNLAGIDIALHCLYRHRDLRERQVPEVDQFAVIERDFGGRSVTF